MTPAYLAGVVFLWLVGSWRLGRFGSIVVSGDGFMYLLGKKKSGLVL